MTIQSISEEVRRIQKKYGESDPFRLAQAMKIIVVLKPMGRYKGCCKGFYVQHRRIKHITINSDLPEVIQRVILAHEITTPAEINSIIEASALWERAKGSLRFGYCGKQRGFQKVRL